MPTKFCKVSDKTGDQMFIKLLLIYHSVKQKTYFNCGELHLHIIYSDQA